jgi:hypothetical protein
MPYMIRTQVYLTEEQARDIKLQAKRENSKRHLAPTLCDGDPRARMTGPLR